MRIIKHSERVTNVRFSRVLEREDGSGFWFDCDKDGKLAGRRTEKHVQQRLQEDPSLVDLGVQKSEWSYKTEAIGLCNHCETEVELCGFTNECPQCGTLYNWGGQELAHPSLWGEETGEHPSDLLRIA